MTEWKSEVSPFLTPHLEYYCQQIDGGIGDGEGYVDGNDNVGIDDEDLGANSKVTKPLN